MKGIRRCIGIGVVCSVKLKVLHPKHVVNALHTNPDHDTVIFNLVVVGEKTRAISNRKQVIVLLRHELFAPHGVYAVRKWCKVTVEGPHESIFGAMV